MLFDEEKVNSHPHHLPAVPEDINLLDSDPKAVRGQLIYPMGLNSVGAVFVFTNRLQEKVFKDVLKIPADIESRFGYMLKASNMVHPYMAE